VLQEFQIPATLYLTTYYSDHRYPVFDNGLRYVLWKGRESGADVGALLTPSLTLPINTEAQRTLAAEAFQSFTDEERMNGAAKHELLRKVGMLVGVDVDQLTDARILQIMSPDEVNALPQDLVSLQLHTHRHRTPRNELLFKREMEDNGNWLRTRVSNHHDLVHFCYPSGDYSAIFLGWLDQLGVESATTCVPGLCSRNSHPLMLPRFVDGNNTTLLTFEAWTAGLAAFIPRRQQYWHNPSRS
jgi:hypothetical protein